MGSGVGMSQHAAIRVATDSTLWAMPETGIGYFTDAGATWFLPRICGNSSLGLFIALTGHRIRG